MKIGLRHTLSFMLLCMTLTAHAINITQGSAILYTDDASYITLDAGSGTSLMINESVAGEFTAGQSMQTLVLSCPAGFAFGSGTSISSTSPDITHNFSSEAASSHTAYNSTTSPRYIAGGLWYYNLSVQWVSATPGTYYVTYDGTASSGSWGLTHGQVVATITLYEGGTKFDTNGTGGGMFNATSTWKGGVVPGATDSVTVKAGDALTVTTASVGDFVVMAGATVTHANSSTFYIYGDYILNGTQGGGNTSSHLRFVTSGATISGSGSTNIGGRIYFDENVTFLSDANVTLESNSISIAAGKTVTNNGTVTLGLFPNATLDVGSWVQGVNSTLNIGYDMAWNLTASAFGNTVNYYRTDLSGGQNISPTIYHNLTLSGKGIKSMMWGNVTVNGAFTIYNNCSIDPDGNTLTLYGDLVNYNGSEGGGYYDDPVTDGTVLLTGTNTQSIEHIGGKAYFENLTINKSTNDVALVATDLEIGETLTLTRGDIVLGANDVIIAGEDGISGGSALSYLQTEGVGMLEVPYTSATGVTRSYPIGDASNYMPFEFTLNSATLAGGANMRFFVKHTAHAAKGDAVSYITRYYTYEPTGFSGTIDYDMTYTYLESDIVGSEANLKPGKHDGAGWMGGNEGSPDPQPWATINTSTNTIDWIGVSSFSDASALDGNEILPVTLLGFTATYLGQEGVKLSWTTSMEENNDYFTVERSADAQRFEEIMQVNGAGNYDGLKEYTVYDRNPIFGTAYYRLKQTDFDGTTETFHIVQVRSIYNNTLQVFPNPVKDNKVRIAGAGMIDERTRVTVSDITGNRLAIRQTVVGRSIIIQFPQGTRPGVYICNISTQGMESKAVRIVVEQ